MPPLPDRPTYSDANTACRNCGAALTGPYCATCGQEARERIVPFLWFASEQLHDFFSFDTRFFSTLGWLIRRPGFLTNEYVAGRRARYMAPLRLYLIVSFLFFFTLTLLQVDTSGIVRMNTTGDLAPADSIAMAPPDDRTQTARSDSTAPLELEDQRFWLKRRLDEGGQKMRDDQAGFTQDLVRRIPSMMFFLLPVFALVLKLLYVRRGTLYAQHFVFALHIHAFAFLILLVLWMLALLGVPFLKARTEDGVDLMNVLFLIGVWIHLFLAMRRVYRQSRITTSLKLVMLTLLYMLIFGAALITTAFITLLFF